MLFDSLDRMSPSLSHRMCIPVSIFPGQDISNRFIASLLLLMEKTIGQAVDLENTPPKTKIDTKNCSILEGSYTFSKAHHFVYPWSFLPFIIDLLSIPTTARDFVASCILLVRLQRIHLLI